MNVKDHLELFTTTVRGSDRPIGMLLGAGCATSVRPDGEPLIPGTEGMTDHIAQQIEEDGRSELWDQIISIGDFDDDTNIEAILNLVRDLRPHVGDGEIRGLDAEELAYLEKTICSEIIELVDKDLPEESGYDNLAKWIASIEREHPLEVFTTNYDLLIEQAFEKYNVPYFDGFVGARRPFFDSYSVLNDDLPSRWHRLWKIHGSINWTSDSSETSVQIWRSQSNKDEDTAVIHPSHLKYNQSRKMPYLAYLDRLKQFLNTPESVLFVNGYSFGDQHLNETITDGLQGPASTQVFAFLFRELDEYPKAKRLAKNHSDIAVFAEDAGIIGTQKAEWITTESTSGRESDAIGVEWETTDDDSLQQKFTLGDFQSFGRLLGSVLGEDNE